MSGGGCTSCFIKIKIEFFSGKRDKIHSEKKKEVMNLTIILPNGQIISIWSKRRTKM